ncbi:unnamed protein product [Brassica oleracea var. botrytis]|uniref:DUF4283 domain-containing protein n=1 Tax=Brassica oleracea TaxID=3712 RepID=A0A3P6FH96_BRAOL|nr:unnamed protein product [Brassica oleracea]
MCFSEYKKVCFAPLQTIFYISQPDDLHLQHLLEAQAEAVNLLCGAKTQSNSENTVENLTKAGKGVRVFTTPTSDFNFKELGSPVEFPTTELAPAEKQQSSTLGVELKDPSASDKMKSASQHPSGNPPVITTKDNDTWCTRAKGAKYLKKWNDSFILPSGEACIKIPNSVIERNKRSWDCFVIGQFYTDPPSQGTIHNIVNGTWNKQYRDIIISKLEGNAFLFRIPNVSSRNRVITQVLWQIEGKTMFVAKWEPGVIPAKPELKSAPIWLELTHVPYQFFNEKSLECIASLVGYPEFIHPATANKTNLKSQSLWMPPVCAHCKGIGHNVKGCSKFPKTCATCKSESHTTGLIDH